MWESFIVPEFIVEWDTVANNYMVWRTPSAQYRKFNTYYDAICYVYNMAYNGALELSLESIIKLLVSSVPS